MNCFLSVLLLHRWRKSSKRSRTRLVLEQLEGRVTPSVLIPVTNRRDLVYDPTRNLLDITTASGQVQRYDVAGQTLLSPWTVGTSLNGADITPDGSALYVAENQTSGPLGILHQVNLSDGSVTDVTYNRASSETGVWDVAVANNGRAFFSTRFAGSGWVPFRQLDLNTGSVSIRTDAPGSGGGGQVAGNTYIDRSADGSQMFMKESAIFTYESASNSFPQHAQAGGIYFNAPTAVSGDGSLIATGLGGVSIMDRNFHSVHTLGTNFNGGLTFDPSRDLLYVADTAAYQVVAFDTGTWEERFRLDIGEGIPAGTTFGSGEMTVSSDGSKLFMSTPSGVRMIDLPASTGVASRLDVSGFPSFISAGTQGSLTVTARDPAGNVDTGFTGTVHLTSTDPAAQLDPDYPFTASDHGVHSFHATLQTGGTFSITASDDADGLTGSQTNVQVHTAFVPTIPVPNPRALIYDSARGLLYVTTADGLVQRYDPTSQTLLAPFHVGASLWGADITPDGAYLYTSEAQRGATQGMVHRVNLNDGTVTNFTYNRAGGEGGTWDIAIANNGKALFTSRFEGSGSAPLHELDLATGTITNRQIINQDTHVRRGTDGSLLFLTESNISSGPILTYDPATDSFPQSANTNRFYDSAALAVNRDGSLIATQLGGVSIMDKNFRSVRVLGPRFNGGLTFDPTRDFFYAADAAAGQIVAFDTNTWAEQFRLSIGAAIPPFVTFGSGEMSVSADDRALFISTPSGIRILALPATPGVVSAFQVSGFPVFTRAGTTGTVTVTAVDAFGYVVPGYTGTVHFSSTDSSAQLHGDYMFTPADQGTHSFPATFNTPGTYTLRVEQADNPTLFGTQTNIAIHNSNPVSVIPVTNRRDHVFDASRGLLYVTTPDGLVQRYDPATQTLLAPWDVGVSLWGADITLDGAYLYTSEGQRGATQGMVHRVNLNDGTVTNFTYNLAGGEGGTWDIAIANNGKALVTSRFEGSGNMPLHELDLSTGVITNRQNINQDTHVRRGTDASVLFLTESNSSAGPILTYDPATDSFPQSAGTAAYYDYAALAVNRDGSLIATQLRYTFTYGISIMDKNFHSVRTLGPNFDGGLTFDPTRDLFYAADPAADQIVAFDTNTWTEQFRLNVGEAIEGFATFGSGQMSVSADDRVLFISTPSGVRMLALPANPGVVSGFRVSGFPIFTGASTTGTVTVTAVDTFGYVVPGYTGTVHFSSTDPTAQLYGDYMFTPTDQGTHDFPATFNTPGTYTLRVEQSDDPTLFGTQTNIVIHDGNPVSLIPVPNRRDLISDPSRGLLYITTSDGLVERYDPATESLLYPWHVGVGLYGADITPDGAYLYASEAVRGATQGMLHKINLNDGTVTNVTYNLSFYEGGTWAVSIANNGKALFTGDFEGSGWVPVHELDLATGVITNRQAVRQHTHVRRGEDRSLLYLMESNTENGPIHTYDPATDSFPHDASTSAFLGASTGSVSRNGALIAMKLGSDVRVMDPSLNLVVTLHNLGGGLVFDTTRDMVYAATSTQIIAYDTTTWAESYRFNIGQTVPTATPFDSGEMKVSDDGSLLFFSTPTGVRIYPLGSGGGAGGFSRPGSGSHPPGATNALGLSVPVAPFLYGRISPSLEGGVAPPPVTIAYGDMAAQRLLALADFLPARVLEVGARTSRLGEGGDRQAPAAPGTGSDPWAYVLGTFAEGQVNGLWSYAKGPQLTP
jgi:ribosomal protein L24E